MKTPKEILLETHQSLAPRLDKLREEVLAAELSQATSPVLIKRRNIFTAIILKLWNELIWPSRRTWAGLAAVWVALAVVHFSQHDRGATFQVSPDPQILEAWNEQQAIFEQLANERRQLAEKTPANAPPITPEKSANWATTQARFLA